MRYSTLTIALASLNFQYAFAKDAVEIIQQSIFTLPVINVSIESHADVGQTIYNAQQLHAISNTNKTISDFLKVHPSVQFSQDNMSAGKQGELKASDISINGALPYENKILLDNVSLNNQINPAGGSNEFATTGMGGSSFANTINTDLICELEVLDSNVSAEYGEFTGGVVKAKTCAPKTAVGDLKGQVNYDYTHSSWSRFNYVDDAEQLKFENNDEQNYQQDFIKQGLSAVLYGRVSEEIGFNLGVSQRWSDIDYTSKLVNINQSANQKRENQNLNLNVYARINPTHDLKIGVQYQNDQKDLNQVHVQNSNRKIDEENTALELELKSHLTNALVTQSLVYQDQSKQSDGQTNAAVAWNTSPEKNWSLTKTASEGVFGDQKQSVNSLEYKFKAEWDTFKFADTAHRITAGAGYGHYEADWQRLADAYSYFLPTGAGIAGIDSCLNNAGVLDEFCDASYADGKGQYHIRRTLYGAGNIEVEQDRGYIFLEDKLDWKNTLKANAGLRVDYDSISKQTNFSPRTSVQYLPFADERLKLTTGWNRYYANNAFGYKLQDGTNLLAFNQTRNSINSDWISTDYASKTNTQRSQLDVPKTDETLFAINTRLGLFDAQLKYVHRDNKDQVRKHMTENNPITYIYDNLGKSQADIYTFTFSNHTPINVASSQHLFGLGLDYSDVTRNFNDYDDSLIPSQYSPYILYEGHFIEEADLPASNFARPWTARLTWNTKFTNIPLNIHHLFRYRSSYDAIVSSTIPKAQRPEFNGYEVMSEYKETKIGSAFNWDLRATYEVKFAKDQSMTLGMTVNNVLNKHNKYTESGSAVLKSEVGRQFVADMSFKF